MQENQTHHYVWSTVLNMNTGSRDVLNIYTVKSMYNNLRTHKIVSFDILYSQTSLIAKVITNTVDLSDLRPRQQVSKACSAKDVNNQATNKEFCVVIKRPKELQTKCVSDRVPVRKCTNNKHLGKQSF